MKKFYNPRKQRNEEDLFDDSVPVFSVSAHDNAVNGYKGAAVYLNVEAENEDQAKEKALKNKEFIQHLNEGYKDKKYLSTHEPSGLFVIGRVEYFEGDPRL